MGCKFKDNYENKCIRNLECDKCKTPLYRGEVLVNIPELFVDAWVRDKVSHIYIGEDCYFEDAFITVARKMESGEAEKIKMIMKLDMKARITFVNFGYKGLNFIEDEIEIDNISANGMIVSNCNSYELDSVCAIKGNLYYCSVDKDYQEIEGILTDAISNMLN